jgi:serine/threonine protein kinase
LTGRTYGNYLLRDDIGGGGFSIIFEAEDVRTNHLVALKVQHPNSSVDDTQDFAREGVLLNRMNGSSNVVEYIESGSFRIALTLGGDGGFPITLDIPYHAMELAEGCLKDLLMYRNEIRLLDRVKLWRGIVVGIHQLHLRSIVHRDIKSANCLMFTGKRNHSHTKVTDLGRSRDIGNTAVHSPFDYLRGRGDLSYAPPEFLMWQGEDSAHSHRNADLYGIGSVLFELITGQGITSMAFGDYREVVRAGLYDYTRGQYTDLSSLRSAYAPCFELFEELVPSNLRPIAGPLVRQLCSPIPTERCQRSRVTGRPLPGRGLEWLITRTDILIKNLRPAPVVATRRSLTSKGA